MALAFQGLKIVPFVVAMVLRANKTKLDYDVMLIANMPSFLLSFLSPCKFLHFSAMHAAA